MLDRRTSDRHLIGGRSVRETTGRFSDFRQGDDGRRRPKCRHLIKAGKSLAVTRDTKWIIRNAISADDC